MRKNKREESARRYYPPSSKYGLLPFRTLHENLPSSKREHLVSPTRRLTVMKLFQPPAPSFFFRRVVNLSQHPNSSEPWTHTHTHIHTVHSFKNGVHFIPSLSDPLKSWPERAFSDGEGGATSVVPARELCSWATMAAPCFNKASPTASVHTIVKVSRPKTASS